MGWVLVYWDKRCWREREVASRHRKSTAKFEVGRYAVSVTDTQCGIALFVSKHGTVLPWPILRWQLKSCYCGHPVPIHNYVLHILLLRVSQAVQTVPNKSFHRRRFTVDRSWMRPEYYLDALEIGNLRNSLLCNSNWRACQIDVDSRPDSSELTRVICQGK